MFNLNLKEFPQLETIENDQGRWYIGPTGLHLPSVTTVANFGPKDYLKKWQKRIGEKEAERIRKIAANRGNLIHNLCETHLKNESVDMKPLMPNIKACFLSIREWLNQNIDNIEYLETCLYSEKIGLAGRVDCIANHKGLKIPVILDFKGSDREKELAHILPYCLQVTFYSMLYEDMTGIKINHALIVMAIESTNKRKIFPIIVDDYKEQALDKIREYNQTVK